MSVLRTLMSCSFAIENSPLGLGGCANRTSDLAFRSNLVRGSSQHPAGCPAASGRSPACASNSFRFCSGRHLDREIVGELDQGRAGVAVVDEHAADLLPEMAVPQLVVDQHVALLGMVALVAGHG